MYSRSGWYAGVVAIWLSVIALGCIVTYFLFRLPWHPYLLDVLAMALWITLGFAMAGPWSYASHRRDVEDVEPPPS